MNLYEFCGNNPILYIDPSGKSFIADWWEEKVVQPIADGISVHWNRNDGLNEPSLLPKSPEEARRKKWRELKPSESVYHNRGGANNLKFVSPDGHLEVVYDYLGNIVTDNNAGTYNLYGPDNKALHFIFDMVPYYFLGNGPDDAFDYWDRVKATAESILLKIQGK